MRPYELKDVSVSTTEHPFGTRTVVLFYGYPEQWGGQSTKAFSLSTTEKMDPLPGRKTSDPMTLIHSLSVSSLGVDEFGQFCGSFPTNDPQEALELLIDHVNALIERDYKFWKIESDLSEMGNAVDRLKESFHGMGPDHSEQVWEEVTTLFRSISMILDAGKE